MQLRPPRRIDPVQHDLVNDVMAEREGRVIRSRHDAGSGGRLERRDGVVDGDVADGRDEPRR